MTEYEYYQEFMQDIFSEAGAEKDFTEEIFTTKMCEFLVEQAVVDNYESVFFKKTRQGIRIDAWNFNLNKQELSLFICDYEPVQEMRTLTKTDVDKYLKRLEKFFLKAQTETFYHSIEEADPIYGVARYISKFKRAITKVQFYLLSNASLGKRFKGIESRKIEGYETVYDIWDISRLARIAESGRAKEDIIIDFTEFVGGGIKCLPAYTVSKLCKSYLLVIPGNMLANIYDKYGDRLLEQNVRTFLQFRGKVNKGIRNTLKNEPDMFFAYNNGLTCTAEKIEVLENSMLNVTNLQIVNGAQTTASIFMAKLKGKQDINLDRVFVQVKLSVINDDRVDEIVPVISKCANTQNKVSSADFFSNHPFHKRIEDFSRRILAPSSEGNMIETYWFYERARGQYANQQAKMTQSEKNKFQIQNPKHQCFTKTDLAKYENSLAQMPHYVSKGAQWNFGKFAEEICGNESNKSAWETNESHFNELYYKQLVAKAIIFKGLDKLIMKQEWYGGYKANIVTYTLAKFSSLVASEGLFIDYIAIWKRQKMSYDMLFQLLKIAKLVNSIITDTEENVTQYCKKAICWEKIRKAYFELDEGIYNDLLEKFKIEEEKKDAKKIQKVMNGIEAQIYVYNKGVKYWTSLIQWSAKENLLSDKHMSILSTTSRMNIMPPSEKQCECIISIEQRAIDEGFYYNEK